MIATVARRPQPARNVCEADPEEALREIGGTYRVDSSFPHDPIATIYDGTIAGPTDAA